MRRYPQHHVEHADVASQKNVSFIDYFDAFLGPDGKPNDDLFVADHLHPSPAGYQLRVRILKPLHWGAGFKSRRGAEVRSSLLIEFSTRLESR